MRRAILSLTVLCLCGSSAFAQGVMRRGAKSIQSGEVTDVSPTEVTLKPSGKDPVKIPANEILYIAYKGEPPGISLARSDEKGGRLEKSLDAYKAGVAAAAADPPGMKPELEWAVARVQAKIALTNAAQADAAVAELEKFRKAHPDHYASFTVHRFLADVYFNKKDYAKAKLSYDQLAKAPWADSKLTADIGQARLLLQENKLDEAAVLFDKVIAGAGMTEESARLTAMLGKAKVLTGQTKYPEALPLLDEVLAKSSPEDTALQAEAYVRLGDCLKAQGETKKALLAYLHVDLLFEGESALHAEALYNLSVLWKADNKPDRADDSSARLLEKYPGSDWARKIKA